MKKFENIENVLKSGIYKITCIVNNKIYIGSACANGKYWYRKGFFYRWSTHVNKLNQNKHRNHHLQNSWNKYGEKNFIFEIIELCEKDLIQNKENYWIQKYEKDGNILFNVIKNSLVNFKDFSKEHKKKISEGLIGKSRPLSMKIKFGHAVIQFDKNMNKINEFYSINEASRITGIQRCDIGSACRGIKIKKAGGYFWKKVKDIV